MNPPERALVLCEVISAIDGRDDELHMVFDRQWLRWRVIEFAKLATNARQLTHLISGRKRYSAKYF